MTSMSLTREYTSDLHQYIYQFTAKQFLNNKHNEMYFTLHLLPPDYSLEMICMQNIVGSTIRTSNICIPIKENLIVKETSMLNDNITS